MIQIKVKELEGFDKSKGLIGANEPTAVYFKTRWGIHTFFMKFAIDVIILNNKNKVVNIKANLKPWRIFLWNPKYKRVMELPLGIIAEQKIVIGTDIEIESIPH